MPIRRRARASPSPLTSPKSFLQLHTTLCTLRSLRPTSADVTTLASRSNHPQATAEESANAFPCKPISTSFPLHTPVTISGWRLSRGTSFVDFWVLAGLGGMGGSGGGAGSRFGLAGLKVGQVFGQGLRGHKIGWALGHRRSASFIRR
jgi:hypothetical protein